MNYLALTGLLIMTMNIIMVMIVLWVNRNKAQLLWAITALGISLFGLGFFIMAISHNPNTALIGWEIGYIGVIAIPVVMLHTVLYFTEDTSKRRRHILYSVYAFSFALQVLNLNQLIINDAVPLFENSGYYIPLGYTFQHGYYGLFMLYFKLTVIYLLYILYEKYKLSKDESIKKRYLFFGLGVGVGFIGGESCFAPTYGINAYPYFGILIGIYPIIILYSIIQHHLFDAKYATLQMLRMLSIIVIASSTGLFLGYLWTHYTDYSPSLHAVEISIWGVVFCIASILHDSKYFSGLFLISSLVSLEKEAEIFLERKGVYKSSIELISDLEQFFSRGMKTKKVSIIHRPSEIAFPKCISYFRKYHQPLVLSELKADKIQGESPALISEIERVGEIIIPIDQANEGEFFFLVLGPKDSEKDITEEELKIINRIVPKIALTLQVLDFNQSLQNEVQIQTKAIGQKSRELEIAYQKLQTVDQNKDNFLAIASHELRTPMTIIKGYADLFLKNALGPLTEEEQRYMKKIYDSTESLIDLVNNILDLSKIEAGRMEKVVTSVDVHALVKKCVGDFEGIYKEKSVLLLLKDNSTTINIMTDEGKIRLILTNLLSNAYKFTSPDGKVEVELFQTEKYLHISVRDTGSGIPAKQLPHIFEKFNQSSNTNYTKKSIRGTGLGLNLSKQVIEMLGGTIGVSSEEGKGSCFEFTLPL